MVKDRTSKCECDERTVTPLYNWYRGVYWLKRRASSRSFVLYGWRALVWSSGSLSLEVCIYIYFLLFGTGADASLLERFTSNLYHSLYVLILNYAVNMLEWLIEYSNPEAKLSFVNTLIVNQGGVGGSRTKGPHGEDQSVIWKCMCDAGLPKANLTELHFNSSRCTEHTHAEKRRCQRTSTGWHVDGTFKTSWK